MFILIYISLIISASLVTPMAFHVKIAYNILEQYNQRNKNMVFFPLHMETLDLAGENCMRRKALCSLSDSRVNLAVERID